MCFLFRLLSLSSSSLQLNLKVYSPRRSDPGAQGALGGTGEEGARRGID